MFASNCRILSVTPRSGEKNGKKWEMIQVSCMDESKEGIALTTPLEFNLDDADKDLAATLRGLVVKIAITKIDTFNGRLDLAARISRDSYTAAYKQAGSPAPMVLGAPISF